LDMAVVADADPALGAGIQRRLHVDAKLLQGASSASWGASR
jgi:hypothetical protein